VDIDALTRVRIEAHFEGHDTQNICGREGVTFYRNNETILPKLDVKNVEFVCDDTFKIVTTNNSVAVKPVVIAVVLATIAAMAFCRKKKAEPMPQKVPGPHDFDPPKSFREGEAFENVSKPL
jgi:hypothetical protein